MIIHEIKRLYVLFSLFIILGAGSVNNAAVSSSYAENRPLIDVHHQPKIGFIDRDTVELLNGAVSKAAHVSRVQLIHKDECFFVREGRTIISIKKYLIDKELRELSLSQDKLITFLQTGGCVRLSQNGCGDYTLKLSGRLLGGSPLAVLGQAAKWLFSSAVKKAAQEGAKKVAQQAMVDPQRTLEAITGIGGVVIFGVSKVGGAITGSASAPKSHSASSPAPVAASKPQNASSTPKLQSVSVSQASSPKAPSAPVTAPTPSLGQSASSSATSITQSAAASKPSCPQSSSSLAPTQSTPRPQNTPATAIHIPKLTATIKDSVVPAALQKVAASSPPQTQPVTTRVPQTAAITTAPTAQPVAVSDTKVAVPAASVSVSIPQQPITHVTTLGAPQKVDAPGLSAQVRNIPVTSQITPSKVIPTVQGPVTQSSLVTITVHDNTPNLAQPMPSNASAESARATQTFIAQAQRGQVGNVSEHNKENARRNGYSQDGLLHEMRVRNAIKCPRLIKYACQPDVKIAKDDLHHFYNWARSIWDQNLAAMPMWERIQHFEFYQCHGFRDSIQSSPEFQKILPSFVEQLKTDPAFAKRCKSIKLGLHTDMSLADYFNICNDQIQRIKTEAAAVKVASNATPSSSTSNNQPIQSASPLGKATTEQAFAKPPCKPVVEAPEKPQGCPTPLPASEKPSGCGSLAPQLTPPTPGCGGKLPEEAVKPTGCGKPPLRLKTVGCEKQEATQKDSTTSKASAPAESNSSKSTPSLETPIKTSEAAVKQKNLAIESGDIKLTAKVDGTGKLVVQTTKSGTCTEKDAAERLNETVLPENYSKVNMPNPVYRKVKETGERCRIVRPLDIIKAELEEWAPKKYEEIRTWGDDVQRIAKNTGWNEAKIKRIKDHLFNDEHILDKGKMQFNPDQEIAAAWDRLYVGDFIKNDIKLLEHEYYESLIEKAQNLNYRSAHDATIKAGFSWFAPNFEL